MCTAAMGLIGPVLNAGLSIAQANVQRQAIYERAAEQQRQYEANKTLALRAYDMQQEQIDKQTVEQVRETQMAAFDQTIQARDVMAQTRAMNASVGRQGRSVQETYGAISQVSGRTVVLRGNDIDTDRIIPARFLKCVTFDGLGAQVFADDRSEQNGEHPFDRPEHQGAAVLIVNRNFGCGSSREHAPQALLRWGIRGVVGESFAEIFYGNCLALGIPCLQASSEEIEALQTAAEAAPQSSASISLEPAAIKIDGRNWDLSMAADAKNRLLNGQWDATSQLLQQEQALQDTAARLPYMQGFVASR